MNNKALNPLRLLNRNFVLLWQGQFVSLIGDNAFSIAMMFWLMRTTGSASMMGLIMMLSVIPGIVLGPFTGAFADRHSRRKIIVFSDLLRGLLITGFAILVFSCEKNTGLVVTALFIVSILTSVIGTFFGPAISASIPRLVPPDKLNKANSMYSFSNNITSTVGQGIGGVMFRVLGAPLLFLIDGISFIFSGISELFIKIPQTFPEEKQSGSRMRMMLNDIHDGFRYILKDRGMTIMILLFTVSNFFLMPLFILLPFYIDGTLKATADWYGYSLAVLSIGSILGTLLAGIKITGKTRKNSIILSMGLVPAFMSVMGLFPEKYVMITCMFLMGINFGFVNVTLMTVLQQTTPDSIRGRVFSVMFTLSQGLRPISLGLSGIIADLLGKNIPPIYTTCGFIIILLTILFSFSNKFRGYLSYEIPEDQSEKI